MDEIEVKKKIKRRKRLVYSILGIYFFMGGVEYAVILPSLWLYIHTKFGAEQWFLGLLLSAYSLAAMIAGPLAGRWVDKTRKPRLILVFSTFWEIAGNVMYFMGISPWFLFGSRLVSGTGAGGEAVILAEVARVTTEEERTGILSTLISIRQMGLLVGPGLNLFLRLANFYIGPFLIDKYSSPGAFMAVVWFIETLLLAFVYTDLHIIKLQEKQAEKAIKNTSAISAASNHLPDYATYSTNEASLYDSVDKYHMETNGVIQQENDELKQNNNGEMLVTCDEDKDDGIDNKTTKKLTWSFFKNEYIREEIMALIAIQFISFFSQISLETMATPLSDKLLHWGEIENSIMYCLAGVEVIFVFILVRILSKKLKDRTMILIGLFTLAVANGYLSYIVPHSDPNTPTDNIAPFAVGIILDMFALPFLVVCSVSLYSKLTAKETQGLSQGFRRSIVGLAAILAPLWAGSTLQWPYILFGVMLGLLGLSLVMLLLSYKRLVPVETSADTQGPTEDTTDEERRPLLQS